jgi:ubiquinone/menaquinone biosynthesis C-methylase UbiE
MKWKEVAQLWDENAEGWTYLARNGWDVTRDQLNTPAFMAMLPDVTGSKGLDIGCGEANNTRLVAKRGATMTGIDSSAVFIEHARRAEEDNPLGIAFQVASATELPFAAELFDFAMATMSLMDIPDRDQCIREAFRVIKYGGFFQFSICHPCFQTRRWEWVTEDEEKIGVVCGDYFDGPQGEVHRWTFTNAPEEEQQRFGDFKVPTFFWTLSEWLNSLIEAGFVLEHFCEPSPSEETIAKHPRLAGWNKIAGYLHIRCRKP